MRVAYCELEVRSCMFSDSGRCFSMEMRTELEAPEIEA